MTRDTVEEPGEGSSIEAKEEAIAKGEGEVDTVPGTEKIPLGLANRKIPLREVTERIFSVE